MLSNGRDIQQQGIETFRRRQEERIGLLETMSESYDDGSPRSFFCRAAALLDPEDVRRSLQEARSAVRAIRGTGGIAARATVLKEFLAEAAVSEGIELRPKKRGA